MKARETLASQVSAFFIQGTIPWLSTWANLRDQRPKENLAGHIKRKQKTLLGSRYESQGLYLDTER